MTSGIMSEIEGLTIYEPVPEYPSKPKPKIKVRRNKPTIRTGGMAHKIKADNKKLISHIYTCTQFKRR